MQGMVWQIPEQNEQTETTILKTKRFLVDTMVTRRAKILSWNKRGSEEARGARRVPHNSTKGVFCSIWARQEQEGGVTRHGHEHEPQQQWAHQE